MRYDPFCKRPMADEYPELGYEEFSDDGLLRFIILMLDEDSPHYRESDLERRMEKCFSALNLGPETEEKVRTESKEYQFALVRWFRLNFSYLFEDWMSRKLAYHEDSAYLRTSLSASHDPEKMIQRKELIKKGRAAEREELAAMEATLFKSRAIQNLVNLGVNQLDGYAEKMAHRYEDL